MDRAQPTLTTATRTPAPKIDDEPPILNLPNEVFREIIAKIDKADNATLSSMTQTCKGIAGLIGTDALLSFFYAARTAYDGGDNHIKITVFCNLIDWFQEIDEYLPQESASQILEHLSTMGYIDNLSDQEIQRLVNYTAKGLKVSMDSLIPDVENLQGDGIQHSLPSAKNVCISMLLSNVFAYCMKAMEQKIRDMQRSVTDQLRNI